MILEARHKRMRKWLARRGPREVADQARAAALTLWFALEWCHEDSELCLPGWEPVEQ